jgi:L-seryl-tRNA(Ser) seleniumtransferase
VGKSIIAGLQATLVHYLEGDAISRIPVWQMISSDLEQIESRAVALATWLREKNGSSPPSAGGGKALDIEVTDGWSKVGGGSLPEEALPTRLIAIRVSAPDELASRLRLGSPPVVGRIERDAFLLDLRTVLPAEDAALRRALQAAL